MQKMQSARILAVHHETDRGSLYIAGNWATHSRNFECHVDNLIIFLADVCSSIHSPKRVAHVFVVFWTAPPLPALSPPAPPPPHFHGHILRAFSILRGEYDVVSSGIKYSKESPKKNQSSPTTGQLGRTA